MPAGFRWLDGQWRAGWRRLALAGSLALLPALAHAQAENGLGAHDTSQPIEIVADRLTVQQADGRAVFEGNVVAEQGELALSAARLIVYYQQGQNDAAPQQAIRRIEVEGDVSIASPSETATGDSGYYDVVGGEIVLTGNVVLTREANVVTGDRLEIDVARRLATMSTTDSAKGRVRALFQPSAGG
jgi:lipopolysaccharide export system protein LptA